MSSSNKSMEHYDRLLSIINGMKKDTEKFYGSGNNVAGTRVRKGLQEIKKTCKEMRDEIRLIREFRK